MKKTYVVLENSNASQRTEPYTVFVFSSLQATKECKEINEFSLVFSTEEQLRATYEGSELFSILNSIEPTFTPEHDGFKDEYSQFFNRMINRAKRFKPPKQDKVQPKQKVTTSVKILSDIIMKAVPASSYKDEAVITVNSQNPYTFHSNRWHNFEAIASSKTVAEALAKMKKLIPGGNRVDIKLAIQRDAIYIGDR